MIEEKLYKKFLEWLEEDAPYGDITSRILDDSCYEAVILAKDECVLAGLDLIKNVMPRLGLEIETYVKDGNIFSKGQILARIRGNIRKILLVERTLLNFIARLSGIATQTRELLEKARRVNPRVVIAATRKTTPGLRIFEKYAVEIGGGKTHRWTLSDMMLIKDNHIKVMGSVEKALEKARGIVDFSHKIEIEVTSVKDALTAAKLGVDIIMLDNMTPQQVEETIELLKREGLREKVLIEVSGGININNIMYYAKTGVDIISVGSITHSVKSCDISLEVEEPC